MPRKKSEKNQRRDKMLEIFQQLDAVGQGFALRYVEKLMELQKLEAFVDKVNEKRSAGNEACSFCGKPKEEVGYLLAGAANVYICDACVRVCTEVLASEEGADTDDQRS